MTRDRLVKAVFCSVLATGIGCAGSEAEEAPDDSPDPVAAGASTYVERGARPVGFTVLEGVKTWYPAEPAGPEEITYTLTLKLPGFPPEPVSVLGRAFRDAPVVTEDGPYPVVVLSHGFSMNPEWYHTLAEHLASHGFVVFGPEHAESDWVTDVVASSVSRPADVRATIDLAARWETGAADVERVAVVGHSYGGYTALAAAGARFDLEGLAVRCEGVEDPFVAAYFCDPFLGAGSELAALLGLDAEPTGPWPAIGDDRVDAIVPIAGDAYLFGEQGLASVQVPTMLIGGTADTGTPWEWGAGLAFDGVASDERALVSLRGAEHFAPVSPCADMPWTASLPPEYQAYICDDPAWDKLRALDTIHHFTTAFLRHTLADDPVAAAVLDPEHYAEEDGLGYVLSRSN